MNTTRSMNAPARLGAIATMILGCTLAACSSDGGEAASGAASPGRAGNGGGSNGGGSNGGGGNGGGSGSGSGLGNGNTNVNLSGAQDFGFFRAQLDQNQVPDPGSYDAAGFFAEHHSELPEPSCGERICLQSMLAVMGNLTSGENCTMLQLGLNSPIAADPGERPPLNLSIVIDTSGSMGGSRKLEFVREGLGLLVDELRDGDKIALVTYSDGVSIPFSMDDVSLHRGELRALAGGLVAGGGTNIHAGLETGYLELMQHYDSGRQNRVILLSDGVATAGVRSTSDILSMSQGYNSDGLGLTTVGLGTDFNQDLMQGLALQADGNFYFLENASAVSEVFTEELSFFTVPVAFDLKLELLTGSNYEFGRAYGSPFWNDTVAGGTLEVPSLFLAHREADDDVHQGTGRRGGGSALLVELMPGLGDGEETESRVASVKVEFREPGTNRIVHDQVDVMFPYAHSFTPVAGHFSSPDGDPAAIQKSFVMLNIFVAMDRACREFHEGPDVSGTVADLDRLLAAVQDYNAEVADTDISLDIELLEQLRAVLVANGADEPNAPDTNPDPWPAD